MTQPSAVEVSDAERLERIAELWIAYRKALGRGEYLHANDLSGDPEALLEIAARLRVTTAGQRPSVTAEDVAAIATDYDKEYRGGIGRGDIDRELAERLANWVNTGVASPGPTEQETERVIRERGRGRG